ncbi:inter-alpha-trypsin inhibitor heavy chain H4 isoform X2 [Nannospalax galili]|uniref:inter-alpha-trypsin inhibitor heavy chain H4 isoform X2 n=1 Tax=Nannospalax galili TaxID=1026970 RepID=UPI00111BDF5E|nr:inter-alpha-trypsin inhibitor heavy chain H4 isoform X2 [Nannospalax galili]
MKIPAPSHTWSIVLILPSLLAILQTTTARKKDIDIYSLTVDSRVSSRFAHTVITSRVVNRADTVQEATFQIELPKKAFITNFSMIIDGVTYPGNIKSKDEAQEQYRAAVGRGESAGLINLVLSPRVTGRKTEQFQVSVNVAPAAKVTFELIYQELLRRHLGTYELLLKVQPQQLVKHLQMDIHIFEPQGISFLETESTFMTQELAESLTTSQNKTKAHIRFKPTLSQQQKSPDHEDTVLDGEFIIRYDVNRSASGGSIQIENGYFVHYFAPENLPTMPKNVIFVIDKSGSMSGRKIHQTREALIKILNDLNPKDQFNLIVFNEEATQWKPSLKQASAGNVKEATDYAASIHAQGGTNINKAVLMAVDLLDNSNRAELLPAGSVSLIILLTDGQPTSGETNPTVIQRNVKEAISSKYSLFCLGFGFDVDYAFLEKLALGNGGLARRIYKDSDSALQLQDFYQEVANPLLLAVAFEYPSHDVEVITQDSFRHHFKGSEMVVAGKLPDQGPDVLSAKVSGQMHLQNITFETKASVAQQEKEFHSPKYIFHNFMERLWAYMTIQQKLEQIVSASDAELEALKAQALELSLKYNFVTPLTSMVVTKPEGQDQFQVAEKPVENDNTQRNFQSFGASRLSPGVGLKNVGARIFGQPALPRQPAPAGQPSFASLPALPGFPGPDHFPYGPGFGLQHNKGKLEQLFSPYSPWDPRHALLTGNTMSTQSPSLNKLLSQHPSPPTTLAPLQAPTIILSLPGPSVDQLCIDMKPSERFMNLLTDADQGLTVTGQYDKQKAGFSSIKIIFRNPELLVHASPDYVVVIRNQKHTGYKWKQTVFSVFPDLKMTMDKRGLLLLKGPDKVTIGLLSRDSPQKGLLLFLNDTHHLSSNIDGELGQFYQDVLWEPPEGTDSNQRKLRVQGNHFLAIRELKLDYQQESPGTEISCWTVKI